MEYLTKEDFLLVNQKTAERHGGKFIPPSNFLNEKPLDYLIEAVNAQMFGQFLYPTIHDKAGLYMYNVISNHVFQDGNKRTGLEAALLFLGLNGWRLQKKLTQTIGTQGQTIPQKGGTTNEILTEFTLEMAAGQVSLIDGQNWFKDNIIR